MENVPCNGFQELEKAFYRVDNTDKLLYFTGTYEQGLAVFEDENGKPEMYFSNRVSDFFKLNKNEIEGMIKDSKENGLKEKANWLEKGLKR